MWKTQQRLIAQLPLHERQTKRSQASDIHVAGTTMAMFDPHAQLRYNLSKTLPELERKHDCNFIIMGDFNVNLNKVTPELKSLLNWGKQEDLVNIYLAEINYNTRPT